MTDLTGMMNVIEAALQFYADTNSKLPVALGMPTAIEIDKGIEAKKALSLISELRENVPDGLEEVIRVVPICEGNTVIQMNIEHTFTPMKEAAKLLQTIMEKRDE